MMGPCISLWALLPVNVNDVIVINWGCSFKVKVSKTLMHTSPIGMTMFQMKANVDRMALEQHEDGSMRTEATFSTW